MNDFSLRSSYRLFSSCTKMTLARDLSYYIWVSLTLVLIFDSGLVATLILPLLCGPWLMFPNERGHTLSYDTISHTIQLLKSLYPLTQIWWLQDYFNALSKSYGIVTLSDSPVPWAFWVWYYFSELIKFDLRLPYTTQFLKFKLYRIRSTLITISIIFFLFHPLLRCFSSRGSLV